MKKLALVIAIITLAGCATMKKNEMVDFQTLVKQTEAAIQEAAAIGGEWRDTRKIFKKGLEAEKAGKHNLAVKLIKKAKKQAELGIAQAKSQRNAGPWLF